MPPDIPFSSFFVPEAHSETKSHIFDSVWKGQRDISKTECQQCLSDVLFSCIVIPIHTHLAK